MSKTPHYRDVNFLLEMLKKRKSIRNYRVSPIEPELIDKLLAAAASAPAAGGRKNWKIRVMKQEEMVIKLSDTVYDEFRKRIIEIDSKFVQEELKRYENNFFWFKTAPLLLAVFNRKTPEVFRQYLGEEAQIFFGSLASAAMAVQNLLLAAAAAGLGACPLTGPILARRAIEPIFDCPPGFELCCLVSLGHPADGQGNTCDNP